MTALGCATIASITYGVPVADIMGYNKRPQIVRARWHAWRLARVHGWTLDRISREFNRHIDTVCSGLKKQHKLEAFGG